MCTFDTDTIRKMTRSFSTITHAVDHFENAFTIRCADVVSYDISTDIDEMKKDKKKNKMFNRKERSNES